MRVFNVLVILIAFPLLVAAGDDAPPKGWKEVTGGYKKQAYSVWLPTNGKISENETSIFSDKFGQIRVFRTICERKDGSLFAAGQIILPPKLVKATPKERQALFLEMFLEEFKGKLVEEKKANLGAFAGKEYLVETPNGMGRFLLLGTGVQVYRVIFVGTKEQMKSKDVDIFFKSFKRMEPKKATKDK